MSLLKLHLTCAPVSAKERPEWLRWPEMLFKSLHPGNIVVLTTTLVPWLSFVFLSASNNRFNLAQGWILISTWWFIFSSQNSQFSQFQGLSLAGSPGSPQHFFFTSFENKSASLWWLAVRMCRIFVLDLMPSCLSNKDCKALRRIKGWTLIPGCYRGTLSQQEWYEAVVSFGDFVNWNMPVSLIHRDALLFAKPPSLQEIKCKPDRACLLAEIVCVCSA